jgi:HEPN domain-containing protein
MNKPRRFKKDYALELQRVAWDDYQTAVILQDAKLARKENILFHVQQAIEKSLKALICWRGLAVPLVHDMNEIVHALPNFESVPHYSSLYDLTQFATIRRYEEGVAIFEEEEIVAALAVGKEILTWTDAQLKV